MKLSWFNTSMGTHTNNTKHICMNMNNMKKIQGIKKREFRDSGSIANTKICFEVRATTLRPRLHTEGFPLYRPHRTSHTGNLH